MRLAASTLLAALCLAAGAAPRAAAADARGAMADGIALEAAGSYEEAARRFEEAAAAAPAEGLDPAVAFYDQGCALLKAARGPEAAAAFGRALQSSDRAVGGKAHYNRGLALAAAAEGAEAAGRAADAIALLGEALGSFEGAMLVDPTDEDPKVNHELVSRRRRQLEERMRAKGTGAGSGGQPPPPPRERTDQERQRAQQPRGAPSEMAPDEARTMLDAMRQQEMSQRSRVRPSRGASATVDKPW